MTLDNAAAMLEAEAMIRLLCLEPHPEGGWYCETYRDTATDADGRVRSTAILFLLKAGERSAWHRVDATEVWHFHAGAPLVITLAPQGRKPESHRLGVNLSAGERPQVIVPPGCWQTAEPTGAWTLVGCTVAPGFQFDGFELAPPNWTPPPAT